MNRLSRLMQSFLQTLLSFDNRSSRTASPQEWEARCSAVVPATATRGEARLRQTLALALGILFGILVSAFFSG